MKVKIRNIHNDIIIEGKYKTFQDCIDQNKSNFIKANLSRAILPGVDFSKVNFSGATLDGVNFNRADLTGTNITCYQLYSTSCIDTILDYTLLKIQGSRHLFCAYDRMIRIGCEYHSVDEWLEQGNYTNTYFQNEHQEYKEYIKMYKNMTESGKMKEFSDSLDEICGYCGLTL
jgi:hypothetical protein